MFYFYTKVLTFIRVLKNPEPWCKKIILFLKSFIVISVFHLKSILSFDLIKFKLTEPKMLNVCATFWLNWPNDLRCHKRISPKIYVKQWLRQNNFQILFIIWTPQLVSGRLSQSFHILFLKWTGRAMKYKTANKGLN